MALAFFRSVFKYFFKEFDAFFVEFAVNDYEGQDFEEMIYFEMDLFFDGFKVLTYSAKRRLGCWRCCGLRPARCRLGTAGNDLQAMCCRNTGYRLSAIGCSAAGPLGRRAAGPQGCRPLGLRAAGPQGRRAAGPQGCRPLGRRAAGLQGRRAAGHWAAGLQGRRATGL